MSVRFCMPMRVRGTSSTANPSPIPRLAPVIKYEGMLVISLMLEVDSWIIHLDLIYELFLYCCKFVAW